MVEAENKTRQFDIEELAKSDIVEKLKRSTVLITGATGLIGSELVFALLCANRIKNLGIKIIAHIRNREKAKRVFANVSDRKDLEFIEGDITEPLFCEVKVDYIVHCAGVTSSDLMTKNPVETIMTNVLGTKNLLDFAKEVGVKSFVYLSSVEAYGVIEKDGKISEEDLGYIDLKSPRSSYPESKRLCENLCISYSDEYGLDVKIARPTQTFGAGFNPDDKRVFAEFVRCISEKKDIILHTKGASSKSYCYITDACEGILYVLLKGKKGEIYNIANPETKKSIREVAEMLSKEYGIRVKEDIKEPSKYFPDVNMDFCIKKLEGLGFAPMVDLKEMFKRSIRSFEEEK